MPLKPACADALDICQGSVKKIVKETKINLTLVNHLVLSYVIIKIREHHVLYICISSLNLLY